MSAFIVAVTGGRGYADKARVDEVLDRLPISVLGHGDAPGLDTLAKQWAVSRHLYHRPFPADWEKHGRAAGPIRNGELLDEVKPVLLIAFPGGRGTADMVRQARERDILIIEVSP